MKRYRVGIVGLEHYHVTGWVESLEHFPDQIEIVALYDRSPEMRERLAPTYHDPTLSAALKPSYRTLPFLTDLDALIRDHVLDIALVTLPSATAPAAIVRLAQAGVHLLVDKPGARTADEAESAFAAARAAGVKVAAALTKRYGRGWQDARTMITAGRLGRLISAEGVVTTSSVSVRHPQNLLFNRQLSGGGVLHWLGVHDIDALLWLTGDHVVELQAMTGTVGSETIDVEDVASLSLRLGTGAIATVHYAYALPRPGLDGYLALRGSSGSIKLTSDGNLVWVGPGSIRDPVTLQETTYTMNRMPGYGAVGTAIIDDLLQAIRDDRTPLATGEDLVQALRIIDAAYRSAELGQRLTVAS